MGMFKPIQKGEKIMKRFTVVTALFGIILLAVWMIFQASAPSSKTDNKNAVNSVHSADEAAVPVTGAESRRVAPVYDATGALVSDPTGTIWNAVDPTRDLRIAPVYDATGALISDPTGTISNAKNSRDMKISPVFDATGSLVSDPTGMMYTAAR
jgi:hypothetical protein